MISGMDQAEWIVCFTQQDHLFECVHAEPVLAGQIVVNHVLVVIEEPGGGDGGNVRRCVCFKGVLLKSIVCTDLASCWWFHDDDDDDSPLDLLQYGTRKHSNMMIYYFET